MTSAKRIETGAVMRGSAVRYPLALTAIWLAALIVVVEAHAEIEFAAWELSGRVSLEGRYFPKTGIDPSHQSSHTTALWWSPNSTLKTLREGVPPWCRFFATTAPTQFAPTGICGKRMFCCSASSGRANGKCGWARTGCSGGVAESQHLVDIVNQIDFLEHPNGEVKLGATHGSRDVDPPIGASWSFSGYRIIASVSTRAKAVACASRDSWTPTG